MAKKKKKIETTRAYHTRLKDVGIIEDKLLGACASLLSKVERSIFARFQAGKTVSEIKPSFGAKFSITARHFNGCAAEVRGLIESNLSNLKNRVDQTKLSIKDLEKTIVKIERQTKPNKVRLHFKKRKLATKKDKLERLQDDLSNKRVRVAFGSKKLFRAQYHLAQNGYSSWEEWKKNWDESRARQFFLLGSKDESCGNQSCQLVENTDGTFNLFLRIPDVLVTAEQPKIIELKNIRFPYGKETISAALNANIERKHTRDKAARKEKGQALSFRFKKDGKEWKLFVMTDLPKPIWKDDKRLGRLGVDINQDHLAVAEIDRFGNLVKAESFPLVTYGKSNNQAQALIEDASNKVVSWALECQKPITLEYLDFKKKRAQLDSESPKRARQLSSFAYNAIKGSIAGRAYREGIHVFYVNPAYSSFVGRSKFQNKYGITSHQAAALVIGRRSMKMSERPLKSAVVATVGTKIYGTLELPVRKAHKHVWSWWRRFQRQFQAAVAPHLRAQVFLRSSNRIPKKSKISEGQVSCDGKPSTFSGEIPERRHQHRSDAPKKPLYRFT